MPKELIYSAEALGARRYVGDGNDTPSPYPVEHVAIGWEKDRGVQLGAGHVVGPDPPQCGGGPAVVDVAEFVGFEHRHLDELRGGLPLVAVDVFARGAEGAAGQLGPGAAPGVAAQSRFEGHDGRVRTGHVSANPPSTRTSEPVR